MASIPLELSGIAGETPLLMLVRTLPASESEEPGGRAGNAERGGGPIGLVLAAMYIGS